MDLILQSLTKNLFAYSNSGKNWSAKMNTLYSNLQVFLCISRGLLTHN
jgi:hypothetical protein